VIPVVHWLHVIRDDLQLPVMNAGEMVVREIIDHLMKKLQVF
jgi:hypothetical protein